MFVFCSFAFGIFHYLDAIYMIEELEYLQHDQYHPVWGQMENYSVGRDKRKQLLLMLCQHEADRLEVWAQPTNSK